MRIDFGCVFEHTPVLLLWRHQLSQIPTRVFRHFFFFVFFVSRFYVFVILCFRDLFFHVFVAFVISLFVDCAVVFFCVCVLRVDVSTRISHVCVIGVCDFSSWLCHFAC